MSIRRLALSWIAALALFPAVCSAQIYAGAVMGVGGANVRFGDFRGGFRGTLRLFGGYELNRHLGIEAFTLDLGTPRDEPVESTIGAFGVAAVGILPVQRWRFSARLGVLSMDGRADVAETKRTAQGMLALGVGFTVIRTLTLGLETAVSRVEFGAPLNDTARVNWTAVVASYRF